MTKYLLLDPGDPVKVVEIGSYEELCTYLPRFESCSIHPDAGMLGCCYFIGDDRFAPGLKYNEVATYYAWIRPADFIMGRALVVGPADDEGETLDVPEIVIGKFRRARVGLDLGVIDPPRDREAVAQAVANGTLLRGAFL